MLSQELLLTVLDNLDVGVYVLDGRGQMLYCNRAFAEMTGESREEVCRTNVLDKSPYFRGSVSELVYREKQKIVMFQDMTFLDKPASQPRRFRMITSSTPIFDEQGEVVNLVATCEPFYAINDRYRAAQAGQVSRLSIIRREREEVRPLAQSPKMQELFALLRQLAATDSAVLLTGESGTGKDVCAAFLRDNSLRREGPFVEVNCAAMPESLLEAELFGYVGGAFTGARPEGRTGLLAEADGGTLFLNEVNSLPLALQGKLLRILESRRVRPLGAEEEEKTDFRLICAASEDLEELCRAGRFRWDLYYRIQVVPVKVPPLRERKEEIVPLAEEFLREFGQRYGKERSLSPEARRQLFQHSWPGNVRELRNLMERLVVTTREGVLEVERLPEEFFATGEARKPEPRQEEWILLDTRWGMQRLGEETFSLKGYLADCEKQLLASVLAGTQSTYEAAELLKISQPSVVRRKQKYGL